MGKQNVAVGMIVLFLASCAAQAEAEKVVRAEKFEIVDSQGNARAILGMDQDEPSIVFLDKKGSPRFHVKLGADGNPELSLTGDNARFSIWDEKASRYFGVLISSAAGPSVVVSDDPAGAQAIFGIASGHAPVLFMVNDGHAIKGPNHPEVALVANPPGLGGGHVTVNDGNGTNRINLGTPLKGKEAVESSAEPVIQVFDKDHKLVWESPAR